MLEQFDTISGAANGAWMHLRLLDGGLAYAQGPDGRPDKTKPCRIRLQGLDSPDLKAKIQRRAAEVLRARGLTSDVQGMSEEKILALMGTGEESEIENLADAALGWENLTEKGKPLEFSRDAAVDLFTRFPPIRRQAQEFLKDEAAFTRGA